MILVYILVALVVALIVSLVIMKYAGDNHSFGAFIIGILLLTGTGITSIGYAFTAYSWVASDYKATIINREYGTNYTKEEVFFASDVIDTVRELNRQRIEDNGNLINGKEK